MLNTNSMRHDGLWIKNCDFNKGDGKPLYAENTHGIKFDDFLVGSSITGWMTLDADCRDVYMGPGNVYTEMSDPESLITNNAPPYALEFVPPPSLRHLSKRRRVEMFEDFIADAEISNRIGEWGWSLLLTQADTNILVRVGVASEMTSDPPTDGVYFEKLAADTSWFRVGRASGTSTRDDTGWRRAPPTSGCG
jgi:hypothetical protein